MSLRDHQATDAQSLRARAAAFVIARREHADWSEENQRELDSWLAQSPSHMVAYLRVDSAWAKAEKLSAIRPPKIDFLRERVLPLFLRIAAVMAVAGVVGAGAMVYLARPHDRLYSTPVGGRETVTFADGSRIELNTNTIIRARMTTDQRIVWLEKGEAYFHVKHDRMHPFMVFAGDRRVTDLGTEFVMRRDAASLKVAVVQGRVWFDASDKQASAQSALLTPGDVATTNGTRLTVSRRPLKDVATELSWQRGVLVFRRTTLAGAVAEINRYNVNQLVIDDAEVAKLRIGGTFRATNPELFAHAAETMLGLRVENRGNEIVLSR